MRISDWSSDVCSSDLPRRQRHRRLAIFAERLGHLRRDINLARERRVAGGEDRLGRVRLADHSARAELEGIVDLGMPGLAARDDDRRSAARRVGKEWVGTCRSRGSPDNLKKNK